jgi:hypothetical protein
MHFTLPALICALAHGRSIAHCISPFPLTAVLLLGGVLLAGCERAPTESASPEATPNFNFANGPPELFNVIRFSTNDGGFFIVDEKTGLIVPEGLPTDPKTLFLCEGETNPASTLTWQEVGWLRGVIKAHVVGEDVNIHVYRLSHLDVSFPRDPFLHLWCTGTPIAAGTGRVRYVDNDLFGTGGKNNATSLKIRGTVTDLSTGELLRVQAGLHVVQNLAGFPDVPPTVKVFDTFVRLNPIGGP